MARKRTDAGGVADARAPLSVGPEAGIGDRPDLAKGRIGSAVTPAGAPAEAAAGTVYVPPREDGPSMAAIAAAGERSVLHALLEAARRVGGGVVAVEDADGTRLTYTGLLRGAAALSRVIARTVPGETVAIMLPSAAATAVTYFAVLAAGRVPTMLNFTAGASAMAAACRIANVGAVLTSERFVSLAGLGPAAQALGAQVPVLALETLRNAVTWRDKAFALAAPSLGLFENAPADSAAAIVFTSGSEGDPKGVILTHRNLLANVEQTISALPADRVSGLFNPLPVFHSYGLGPGMILPLVTGLRLALHPSPLRVKEVTQRIADTRANVLLTTDTFLRQYARAAEPKQLASLEIAFCGAERVRPETRQIVRSRFDFAVVEAYGVTEASPVVAANHPDDPREGTVGRLLPGIEALLEPVEGLTGGYRLKVRGPNVMGGYLVADGRFSPLPDGWHDTGDVVSLAEGHLSIRGRLKRFAKIGGEMTSLVTVENVAAAIWPDHLHAAAVLPGPHGERIVLLTEAPHARSEDLLRHLQAEGLPHRFMPDRIVHVATVPVLGTGKADYAAVTRLAAERVTPAALGAPAAAPAPTGRADAQAAAPRKTAAEEMSAAATGGTGSPARRGAQIASSA